VAELADVEVGIVGGDVMAWVLVLVVWSLQPQITPGVLHSDVGDVEEDVVVVVGSKHPPK